MSLKRNSLFKSFRDEKMKRMPQMLNPSSYQSFAQPPDTNPQSAKRFQNKHFIPEKNAWFLNKKQSSQEIATEESGRETVKNKYIPGSHLNHSRNSKIQTSLVQPVGNYLPSSEAFIAKLDGYISSLTKPAEDQKRACHKKTQSMATNQSHASHGRSKVFVKQNFIRGQRSPSESSESTKKEDGLQVLVESQNLQLKELKKEFGKLLKKYQKLKVRVGELENDRCENCRPDRFTGSQLEETRPSEIKPLHRPQFFGRARSGFLMTPSNLVDKYEMSFFNNTRKGSVEKSMNAQERTVQNVSLRARPVDSGSPGPVNQAKNMSSKLASHVRNMVCYEKNFIHNLKNHHEKQGRPVIGKSFADKLDQICMNNKLHSIKLQEMGQGSKLKKRRASEFHNAGTCSMINQGQKFAL